MTDQYQIGENVFGKMKGFPLWPAKVVERVPGKEEKYRINFYGTHDESVVKLDQLFRYDAETKAKYGKPQRKAHFKEAMEEIEADILANEAAISEREKDPGAAEEAEKSADSERELMIDEGVSPLLPVLTREVSKPEPIDNSKSKRPRTLSKRDSVSSAPVTPMILTPAATPESSQTPTTEIVSRSGRKIKPKRFADDKITTPVAPGKAGAKGSEEGGTPGRRTKRASNSIGNKPATPTQFSADDATENEASAPTHPPQSKASGGNAKAKVTPTPPAIPAKQSGRLSPDISAPITRGPPSLRPAPVRRSGPAAKKLPALIPTTALPKVANTRRSERQTRSKSTEDENQNNQNAATAEGSEDVEDKENSTNNSSEANAAEENGNESVEPPATNKRRRVPAAHRVPQVAEKKQRIKGKDGMCYELSYNQRNPDSTADGEVRAWQSVTKENVEKLKEDLASDMESQDIVNSTVDEINENAVTPGEAKLREFIPGHIRLLRIEGEVIEIIGEIVGCLNMGSANCERAMELLERLDSHQLTPLMLKKHPEVVATIQKLRQYVGNVDVWGFTPEEKKAFGDKSAGIRQKANDVFQHFQDLFCTDPNDVFEEVYRQEVEKLKGAVEGLSLEAVLWLTGIDELVEEMNDYDNSEEEEEEPMEEA